MQTTIRGWGDTLVMPIPSALAESTGIHRDTLMEVAVENGKLVALSGNCSAILSGSKTHKRVYLGTIYGQKLGEEA